MHPRTLLLALAALAAPLTARFATHQPPAALAGTPVVPLQCRLKCGMLLRPQEQFCTRESMRELDICVQCIADVAPSRQASFAAARNGQARLTNLALSCEYVGVLLPVPSVTAHAVHGATAAPARVSYVPEAQLPTALPAGGRGPAVTPESGVQAATPGGSTGARQPEPTGPGSEPVPLGAEGDGVLVAESDDAGLARSARGTRVRWSLRLWRECWL
ncbi:hypothetical protein BC834DRAFT_548379 [Gloeopeniophorella convolvens]|nr:hypothetical protein BC834DRAFT_548379 [Gloeopeniophorella convolvens]